MFVPSPALPGDCTRVENFEKELYQPRHVEKFLEKNFFRLKIHYVEAPFKQPGHK